MNRGCKVESYSNKYFPNTSLTKTCQPLCLDDNKKAVSYTHLTLPTNREVPNKNCDLISPISPKIGKSLSW